LEALIRFEDSDSRFKSGQGLSKPELLGLAADIFNAVFSIAQNTLLARRIGKIKTRAAKLG